MATPSGKKQRTYRGRPSTLDIHVSSTSGSESVDIHLVNIQRALRTLPVGIGKQSLRIIGESLIQALENYWKNNDFASLKRLAELGYDAFEIISSGQRPDGRVRWRNLFDAPNDVRQAVIRTHFQGDLTFPFGLLCTSKPTTNNYEELAKKFVGAKNVFINSFGLIQNREDDATYVSKTVPCVLAHAIDNNVPGAEQEYSYLLSIEGVKAERCHSKSMLIDHWNNANTGVVHFSCHHRYDQSANQYILTLSDGDDFRALADRACLTRASRGLPFVFMNGCNSGTIFREAPDTFIRSLCPVYSLGMLSTIHSIGGADAAKFAKKYYENWVEGGYAVDALALTKREFIFARREFSAITYEFWEMPEVLRLFEFEEDDHEERLDA